jgi:hypothetical protein
VGTKNQPGAFNCYANAEPDEPMFVLLARDETASYLVEQWAHHRSMKIDKGEKPESDRAMVREALACAKAMQAWHKANRDAP